MARQFTLRRSGQRCTNLRPLIIFSEQEWTDLARLAVIEGDTPERVVDGYLQNFHIYLYKQLAHHDREDERNA